MHVAGGHDGSHWLASMKRYDATFDIWAKIASMDHGRTRSCAAHATLVELNLFDSLILKAKSEQRVAI
jgi:hypothetical protein